MGKSKLLHALGASALTSLLMLVDRLVLNLLPILYWGSEIAGLWILFRAWAFLLMSMEGGVGGTLLNVLGSFSDRNKLEIGCSLYCNARKKQLVWGGGVFLLNAFIVFIISTYYTDLLFFNISYYQLELILIGFYAALYYQSQLYIYYQRGIGKVFSGQMLVNLVKFVEVAVLVICPIIGFEILGCLLSIILVRMFFLVIWRVKEKKNITQEIVELNNKPTGFKITHAYFFYPVIPAVYTLLPLIIVSSLWGGVEVVLFSASKLFGRVLVQLSQVLSRVLWPEIKRMSEKEVGLHVSNILRKYFFLSTLSFIVIACFSFYLDGYNYNDVILKFVLIFLLLVGSYFSGFNDVLASVLVALNLHGAVFLFRFLMIVLSPIALMNLFYLETSIEVVATYFLFVEFVVFMIFLRKVLRAI